MSVWSKGQGRKHLDPWVHLSMQPNRHNLHNCHQGAITGAPVTGGIACHPYDISAHGLIGLIRILIPTSCNFFFGSSSQKTPKFSMLGLEWWVTDRKVLPGCAWVRTKCAGKACVGLWGYSWGPRELSGIGGPSLGDAGHYNKLGNRLATD
jgi:hypothetical protein